MLKVEQLNEMAKDGADLASKVLDRPELTSDDLQCANSALERCAIYTIGAEIVGRLDILIGEKNDHSRQEPDSNLQQTSTSTAGGPERSKHPSSNCP